MNIEEYWNKILEFFALNEEPGTETENKFQAKIGPEQNNSAEKVVSINRNRKFELIFYHPDSYNEVKNIVDDLKAGKVVILNLEDIDVGLARRFIDFISGAIYGLKGNVRKVGSGVFVFTPRNINIDGKEIEDIIKNDFMVSK